MIRAFAVASLAVVTASCASAMLKVPSGPVGPATDASDVMAGATAACRTIRTFSAEVALSGKVNGQRLRGSLLVGVAAPASARVEFAAPFGAPGFILVSDNNDATLVLPRDNRVLEHGRQDDIIAAIAGVPLGAEELRLTLTGCWADGAEVLPRSESRGPDWRVLFFRPDHSVVLHREAATAPWRIVSVLRNIEHGGRRWSANYTDFLNDLPQSVRIASEDSASGGSYDLQLSLSQVETNVTLGPEVFRVDIPRSAQPITLEELRNARPGARKS